MISNEMCQLIEEVVKTGESSITIDWLAYCVLRKVNTDLLDEKEIIVQKSIKSGLPAVGFKRTVDVSQDPNLRTNYHSFIICIEVVEDVNVDSNNLDFVNVKMKQYFICFSDPETLPLL
jgi:hypothetical protein